MDSDTYYWQSNGSDNEVLITKVAIDGYSPLEQKKEETNSESLSSSSCTDTISISQPFTVKEHEVKLEKSGSSNMPVASSVGSGAPLVNPDAIIPKERSYSCRICRKTFPNKSAVTRHSRLHTDHQGKPFSCNFCGKGFSTNFYLKQHERIHSGHKPYKCPMCETTFKQLSHVQQHVRTHTGVRPYKCHWAGCNKAFLQQSHLKSHEDRHVPKDNSPSRPFKCHWPDCGRSFSQLTNLKSHIVRHTPSQGRSKKGSSSSKKADDSNGQNTEEASGFGLTSARNMINQAAAVANIVPGGDEMQIRPFLCPGCSKLYVREATFKKHLVECKAKFQLSISATASALGIPTPPPLLSDADVGSGDLLLVPMTSADPPSKQARTETQQHGTANSGRNPQASIQRFVKNSPGDLSSTSTRKTERDAHAGKDEEQRAGNPEGAKFSSRRLPSNEGDFKFPEPLDTTSLFNIITSEPQMTTQNSDKKTTSRVVLTNNVPTNRQVILSRNLVSKSENSRTDSSGITPHPNLSPSNHDPQTSEAEEDTTTPHHATINEAAISWQWDQAMP